MWLEVYRWYDTRLLGPRNLLLERRAEPRFTSLETIGRFRLTFPGELRLPLLARGCFLDNKLPITAPGDSSKSCSSAILKYSSQFAKTAEPLGRRALFPKCLLLPCWVIICRAT